MSAPAASFTVYDRPAFVCFLLSMLVDNLQLVYIGLATLGLLISSQGRSDNTRQVLAKAGNGLAGLAVGTAIFYLVFVLFGAPLFTKTLETLGMAVLLAALVAYPASASIGPDWRRWIDFYGQTDVRKLVTKSEHWHVFCGLGAILGCWLGVFVIPLDWDMPWQKYPISLFIGSIFCHAVGFLAAVAVEAKGQVVERRQRKKPD